MARKFSSAYEAAEFAATITDEWRGETDELMTVNDLLGLMSVADEAGDIDEDDENCYFIVTDEGAVGMTLNAEKLIHWIATPTKAVIPQAAPVQPAAGRFCTNCGKPIGAGLKFCTNCGAPVQAAPAPATAQQPAPAQKKPRQSKASTANRPHGTIGFSPVIDSPQFLAAVKKHKKSNVGCAAFIILAPVVALTLYCIISQELEVIFGLFIGACISAAFFLIYFLATLKERFQNSWDGIVEQKYEKKVRVSRKRQERDHSLGSWETHYFTVFRDDRGKAHKVEEREVTVYSYFKVGERMRYHGKMGLSFPYEKYDKSHDEYVICPFCGNRVSVLDAECDHCQSPVLR